MNENIKETAGELEVDLWKLLMSYLKNWWLIVLLAVLAAAATLAYTANFVTPLYRAGVTIYVNNTTNTDKSEYVSGADLSTSERLVATYTNMLTSDTVLEQVIEATGQDYTLAALRAYISTEQVDNTEIFRVYVSHADPVAAAQIANAVAQTAPEVIADFVEGSSTKIIDYAKVPTGRYAPSYTRNTMMGALVGVAIALVILTLQVLLDVRIKDESDLGALFELPVLGQIPDLRQNPNKHTYGKYGKSSKYYSYQTEELRNKKDKKEKLQKGGTQQ